MSNENAVYTHELTVRFEEDADSVVSWTIQADEAVSNTCHASYDELVRAGAPLAALGIRALFDLLGEDMIRLVLDQANGYLWKERYRQQSQQTPSNRTNNPQASTNQQATNCNLQEHGKESRG